MLHCYVLVVVSFHAASFYIYCNFSTFRFVLFGCILKKLISYLVIDRYGVVNGVAFVWQPARRVDGHSWEYRNGWSPEGFLSGRMRMSSKLPWPIVWGIDVLGRKSSMWFARSYLFQAHLFVVLGRQCNQAFSRKTSGVIFQHCKVIHYAV